MVILANFVEECLRISIIWNVTYEDVQCCCVPNYGNVRTAVHIKSDCKKNPQLDTDMLIDSFKGESAKRSYKCKQCDKAFIQQHNLQFHKSKHKREGSFKCEAITQQVSFQSHKKPPITKNLINVIIVEKSFPFKVP